MKRVFEIVIAVLFVALSCAQKREFRVEENNNPVITPAIANAINYRNRFFPSTKAGNVVVHNVSYIVEQCDTLAIDVDFDDNQGFVLLTKDGNVPLFVASDGHFDDAYCEIPAFRFTINEIIQGLGHVDPIPIDTTLAGVTEIVRTQLSEYIGNEVEPLIDVNMHQFLPYSFFTPNGYAGCTPVAIAQAFSVYEYPESISVGFEGSSISFTELSWQDLKLHSYYHGDSSCTYCLQNAYLLREIGFRCDANYNIGGTGAWPTISCINSFGYTATNGYTYDYDRIISSLDGGCPVVISGSGNGAHSWNIDGYYEVLSEYSVDTMKNLIIIEHNWNEQIEQTYMHFNYGWGGSSNGYVLAREKVIKTFPEGDPVDYLRVSIFSNSYNNITRLVTHIKPDIL